MPNYEDQQAKYRRIDNEDAMLARAEQLKAVQEYQALNGVNVARGMDYASVAPSTAVNQSFIDLNGVKGRSAEVLIVLINQGKFKAMIQALELFGLVFLATSHGQKDSDVLAAETQKLTRLFMNWPD